MRVVVGNQLLSVLGSAIAALGMSLLTIPTTVWVLTSYLRRHV
jgi:hypothetical protein